MQKQAHTQLFQTVFVTFPMDVFILSDFEQRKPTYRMFSGVICWAACKRPKYPLSCRWLFTCQTNTPANQNLTDPFETTTTCLQTKLLPKVLALGFYETCFQRYLFRPAVISTRRTSCFDQTSLQGVHRCQRKKTKKRTRKKSRSQRFSSLTMKCVTHCLEKGWITGFSYKGGSATANAHVQA